MPWNGAQLVDHDNPEDSSIPGSVSAGAATIHALLYRPHRVRDRRCDMARIDALYLEDSCRRPAGRDGWTTWPERDPDQAVDRCPKPMRRWVYGPSYQSHAPQCRWSHRSAFQPVDLKEVKKGGSGIWATDYHL